MMMRLHTGGLARAPPPPDGPTRGLSTREGEVYPDLTPSPETRSTLGRGAPEKHLRANDWELATTAVPGHITSSDGFSNNLLNKSR